MSLLNSYPSHLNTFKIRNTVAFFYTKQKLAMTSTIEFEEIMNCYQHVLARRYRIRSSF